MNELIREDIVLKWVARVNGGGKGKGEGEGIGGGDAAGHGGSGDLGGCRIGERGCKEGYKGGYDSGEKGFGLSVKEVRFFFFLFPSFLSTVIARLWGHGG